MTTYLSKVMLMMQLNQLIAVLTGYCYQMDQIGQTHLPRHCYQTHLQWIKKTNPGLEFRENQRTGSRKGSCNLQQQEPILVHVNKVVWYIFIT